MTEAECERFLDRVEERDANLERALKAEAALGAEMRGACEDRYALLDRIGKLAALVARIEFALGTNAEGDELVEVARKARLDQRTLAAVEAELQDNHDIDWEGGPNDYMRMTTFIERQREYRK